MKVDSVLKAFGSNAVSQLQNSLHFPLGKGLACRYVEARRRVLIVFERVSSASADKFEQFEKIDEFAGRWIGRQTGTLSRVYAGFVLSETAGALDDAGLSAKSKA